jgi:hypothetical protein
MHTLEQRWRDWERDAAAHIAFVSGIEFCSIQAFYNRVCALLIGLPSARLEAELV